MELAGPEKIEAGKEFEVTATVDNIAEGTVLAQITFQLGFDTERLELVNTANDQNVLNITSTAPAIWENITKLGDEEGTIDVNFTNADDATSNVSKNGELVITFKFKAKENVKEAGLWVVHETVESNDADFNVFYGNGSYLVLTAGEPAPASSEVKTGDGSVNMIVLAIIALVAVAGCAVVIKTRR